MKIAVIGTGVSGLVAAHLLHRDHDITVFEARDRVGGHVHTVDVDDDGVDRRVDTGFIVFNDWTYPNFIALLERLGVRSRDTEMSFSVTDEYSGLEYAGSSANTMFAQRGNLVKLRFWRMIMQIMRFNREAPQLLEDDTGDLTLGAYLEQNGYSKEFRDHYIVPMGGAIWSSPNQAMYEFPARFFVRFFKNHGMLSVNDRPQWRVVEGGSQAYVDALIKPFADRIRLSAPVGAVTRSESQVTVSNSEGDEAFDHVVIGSHSDQALAMLADPTDAEQDVLGSMRYIENDVVLHTDTSLMPHTRRTWSSWNAFVPARARDKVTLTYNMTILQGLQTKTQYLVTLNDSDRIDPSRVVRTFTYSHPLFTTDSVAAQQRYGEIGGVNRTHYCGAYWFNGFHEDGVRSALRACAGIIGEEAASL
jgi:predicted NAD/FAD-binding protein